MTILTAKVTPWSEVAGTFDLDFGSAAVSPGAARRLMARGFSDFMDGITNVIGGAGKAIGDAEDAVTGVVDDIGDAIKGDDDNDDDGLIGTIDDLLEDIANGDVVFDVSSGTPGKRFNVLTDPTNPTNPALVLDCIDCYITGKFKLTGRVSIKKFAVKAFTLDTTPQDFNTTLKLSAAITATASAPASLKLTKEIISFPVPAAGIAVPGIFDLGTTMAYEVGVESTIAGKANFTFGLQSTVPNGAHIVVDLANIDSSTATGFEAATFNPIFDFVGGSVAMSVMAISRPKLTFGVEVVGIGKLEVGLNLGLPKVGIDLATKFNETGVCDGSSSKTGFGVESKALLDLVVNVNGKFGPSSIIDAGTLFTASLLKYEKSIFEKCVPFDIPGLDANGTTTA